MTFTQVEPGVLRRLTTDVESRSARLLYVELLDHANNVGSDGVLPRRVLRIATDSEDPSGDVAALVEAGFLVETADGWEVPDWTGAAHQQAAETVRKRQANDRRRAQRWRDHNAGDHSSCDPKRCPTARSTASSTTPSETAPGGRTGVRTPARPRSLSLPPSVRPSVGKDGGREEGPQGGPRPARPGAGAPDRPASSARTAGRELSEGDLDALAADLGVGPPLPVLRVMRAKGKT